VCALCQIDAMHTVIYTLLMSRSNQI